MKQFETFEVSGDAGIRAFGSDPAGLFAAAGMGMYSLITDPAAVTGEIKIDITVAGEDLEGLLIAFLNELIFHFDAHGFIGHEITLHEVTEKSASATVSGCRFDPSRHEQRLLIKAATYHRLMVRQRNSRWEAEIVFDI